MPGVVVNEGSEVHSTHNLYSMTDSGIFSEGNVHSTGDLFVNNSIGIRSRDGGVHSDNSQYYQNSTGISAGNGELYSYEDTFQQHGYTAIEINRAFAHVAGAIAKNNRTVLKSHKSSSYLFGNTFRQNRIPIDYRQGSRGVLQTSIIDESEKEDIRYERDVVVKIIDTTALDLLNRTWTAPQLISIDANWLAHYIIDTSDIIVKFEWLIRLFHKVYRWVKIPAEVNGIIQIVHLLYNLAVS